MTPWTAACQDSLSFTISRVCTNSGPLNQWYHSTISSSVTLRLILPSIFPKIMVFATESAVYNKWPKYWNLSFNIRPSSEYSGLIYFGIDWFDFLEVQGTLKSLLQYHNLKCFFSIYWYDYVIFLNLFYCWRDFILFILFISFHFTSPYLTFFNCSTWHAGF